MAEAEGIIAWMAEGTFRWRIEGLGKPTAVEFVGLEWRSDMDQFGWSIRECFITGSGAKVKARTLYLAYRKSAEEAGEQPVMGLCCNNSVNKSNRLQHIL